MKASEADKLVEIQQLKECKKFGVSLPPPVHLQKRVVGGYFRDWWEAGEILVDTMNQCLHSVNKDISDFHEILDFGCGPGRVTVPLRYHLSNRKAIYASDIDSEAIAWCQRFYGNVASFQVNDAEPPLRYSDDFFDFIFSIGIFTHIPEDMQFLWLAELKRLVIPGGYLFLTIHGEETFRKFQTKPGEEFIYHRGDKTEGLPDFYQSAFHLHNYIRKYWTNFFHISGIYEGVIGHGHQDAVLCKARKP